MTPALAAALARAEGPASPTDGFDRVPEKRRAQPVGRCASWTLDTHRKGEGR